MTPEDVAAKLVALLGDEPGAERGVVHSAYVDARADPPRFLRIGPFAPPSATDAFLLHAARATAGAIVTTGTILRDEPSMVYDLGAAVGLHDDLVRYRVQRLARREPPRLYVLTRGDVPFAHPALRGYMRAEVVAVGPAAEATAARGREAGVAVDARASLDVLSFLEAVARREGTLLVEAGPATTVPLYASGGCVDELVLTCLVSGAVDERAYGSAFLDAPSLRASFGAPPRVTRFEEGAHAFEVRRYVRAR